MGWTAGGHMGFMGIWWIVILAGLAAAVWVVAAAASGRGNRSASAEQRLKERYAAGEIDRATYEQVLAELRK